MIEAAVESWPCLCAVVCLVYCPNYCKFFAVSFCLSLEIHYIHCRWPLNQFRHTWGSFDLIWKLDHSKLHRKWVKNRCYRRCHNWILAAVPTLSALGPVRLWLGGTWALQPWQKNITIDRQVGENFHLCAIKQQMPGDPTRRYSVYNYTKQRKRSKSPYLSSWNEWMFGTRRLLEFSWVLVRFPSGWINKNLRDPLTFHPPPS